MAVKPTRPVSKSGRLLLQAGIGGFMPAAARQNGEAQMAWLRSQRVPAEVPAAATAEPSRPLLTTVQAYVERLASSSESRSSLRPLMSSPSTVLPHGASSTLSAHFKHPVKKECKTQTHLIALRRMAFVALSAGLGHSSTLLSWSMIQLCSS